MMKRYLLTTPEQCLTLKTFIKNLPPNEKLYLIKPYPRGYEVLVLVETEEKPKTDTEITLTAKNHNILRIGDNGLGGSVYSN
jgi:hypothetical protein